MEKSQKLTTLLATKKTLIIQIIVQILKIGIIQTIVELS